MAQYSDLLNLYFPSRLDANLPVDQPLAQNFKNLENFLGTSLIGANGKPFSDLKKRLDQEYSENKNLIESNSYHHSVSVRYERDDVTGTDYILTRINHSNDEGVITLNRGFASDDPNAAAAETVRSFANRNATTLAINASTYTKGTNERRGADIYNGESLSGEPVYYRWEMGVLADGTLKAYPPETPYQDLINDGVVHSFAGFCPFIIDGQQTLDDYYITNPYGNSHELHPRNAIAQYSNKDILILTCDGRTPDNAGMKVEDMARILHAEGVQFAYNLDGGGSAQTVVRGTLVNRPLDGNGFIERPVPDFIYFSKKIVTDRDNDLLNANTDAGNAKFQSDLNARKIALMGNVPHSIDNDLDKNQPADLNNITESGMYWANAISTANAPSTPDGISWAVMHYQFDANNAYQIAYPFHEADGFICTRRTNSSTGGWHYWREM